MHHESQTCAAPRLPAVLVALTLLLSPFLSAQAQAPPPVKYIGGNQGIMGFLDAGGVRLRTGRVRGINFGEFLLWPSLTLEGRYDTNLFMAADAETPKDAPILRVMPGFAISNPKPNKFALTLASDADLRVYISGDDRLTDQNNVGVRGDFRFELLPNGPVSLVFQDVFRRMLYPASISLARSFNVNNNRAGAKLAIHPGGGALDVGLGYQFVYNSFDDYADGEWLSHNMMFRTTWRFYPKTIAFVEASASLRDWTKAPEFAGFYVDSMNLRSYLGLSGYITKKLATIAKVGYGNSLHDEGPSFEHLIAHGELSYKFSSSILIAGGFLRDYKPAYYSNWFVDNRSYLRAQLRFARRVSLDVSAAYSLVDYAEFDPEATDPERNALPENRLFVSHKERRDQLITAHLGVSIDITRWIGLTLGYELRGNFTKFQLTQTAGDLSQHSDPGEYLRHQVYASVDVRY